MIRVYSCTMELYYVRVRDFICNTSIANMSTYPHGLLREKRGYEGKCLVKKVSMLFF